MDYSGSSLISRGRQGSLPQDLLPSAPGAFSSPLDLGSHVADWQANGSLAWDVKGGVTASSLQSLLSDLNPSGQLRQVTRTVQGCSLRQTRGRPPLPRTGSCSAADEDRDITRAGFPCRSSDGVWGSSAQHALNIPGCASADDVSRGLDGFTPDEAAGTRQSGSPCRGSKRSEGEEGVFRLWEEAATREEGEGEGQRPRQKAVGSADEGGQRRQSKEGRKNERSDRANGAGKAAGGGRAWEGSVSNPRLEAIRRAGKSQASLAHCGPVPVSGAKEPMSPATLAVRACFAPHGAPRLLKTRSFCAPSFEEDPEVADGRSDGAVGSDTGSSQAMGFCGLGFQLNGQRPRDDIVGKAVQKTAPAANGRSFLVGEEAFGAAGPMGKGGRGGVGGGMKQSGVRGGKPGAKELARSQTFSSPRDLECPWKVGEGPAVMVGQSSALSKTANSAARPPPAPRGPTTRNLPPISDIRRVSTLDHSDLESSRGKEGRDKYDPLPHVKARMPSALDKFKAKQGLHSGQGKGKSGGECVQRTSSLPYEGTEKDVTPPRRSGLDSHPPPRSHRPGENPGVPRRRDTGGEQERNLRAVGSFLIEGTLAREGRVAIGPCTGGESGTLRVRWRDALQEEEEDEREDDDRTSVPVVTGTQSKSLKHAQGGDKLCCSTEQPLPGQVPALPGRREPVVVQEKPLPGIGLKGLDSGEGEVELERGSSGGSTSLSFANNIDWSSRTSSTLSGVASPNLNGAGKQNEESKARIEPELPAGEEEEEKGDDEEEMKISKSAEEKRHGRQQRALQRQMQMEAKGRTIPDTSRNSKRFEGETRSRRKKGAQANQRSRLASSDSTGRQLASFSVVPSGDTVAEDAHSQAWTGVQAMLSSNQGKSTAAIGLSDGPYYTGAQGASERHLKATSINSFDTDLYSSDFIPGAQYWDLISDEINAGIMGGHREDSTMKSSGWVPRTRTDWSTPFGRNADLTQEGLCGLDDLNVESTAGANAKSNTLERGRLEGVGGSTKACARPVRKSSNYFRDEQAVIEEFVPLKG